MDPLIGAPDTRPRPCPGGATGGLLLRAAGACAALLLLLPACTNGPDRSAEAPTSDTPSPRAPLVPVPPPADDDPGEPPVVTGLGVASRITGFDRPWDLQFLPDGTPLVTERPGRIAAVIDGRRVVVADVPGVLARGEGGLMGLALDPQFPQNRRIYVCYAHGEGGAVSDVRVARFRLAEDLGSLTEPTTIVSGIPAGAGNRHLGCRLAVGPDGLLWITTGDAVQPSAPQDPTSLAGKVLRATLGGDPAPDNPGGAWDPFVYSLGHRNAQGLAFRSSDGAAIAVEHGTGCDDEINLLEPGANYGWDPRGVGDRYVEGAPMTSPDIPGAVSALWSSGCPTVAPSGAEFIAGEQWGQWTGQLAVAVLKDEHLMLTRLDGREVTDTQIELTGELGRLRTVRNAPDGSLWVTVDASPGDLVQVVPRT